MPKAAGTVPTSLPTQPQEPRGPPGGLRVEKFHPVSLYPPPTFRRGWLQGPRDPCRPKDANCASDPPLPASLQPSTPTPLTRRDALASSFSSSSSRRRRRNARCPRQALPQRCASLDPRAAPSPGADLPEAPLPQPREDARSAGRAGAGGPGLGGAAASPSPRPRPRAPVPAFPRWADAPAPAEEPAPWCPRRCGLGAAGPAAQPERGRRWAGRDCRGVPAARVSPSGL